MSTVLRRLYNVAYGRVRIWREGSSELDEPVEPLEPVGRAAERPAPRPAPEDPDPSGEPPAPTAPAAPRQRRL